MEFNVSIEELEIFAKKFWKEVTSPSVFAFHGPMGAGKTTLIESLCRAKGVKSHMSSPTFSIINEYAFEEEGEEKIIYHIDLYRLKSEEEAIQAGVEDCIYSGSTCFVEWPERAEGLFDENTIHVYVEPLTEGIRRVKLEMPAHVSQNNRNL